MGKHTLVSVVLTQKGGRGKSDRTKKGCIELVVTSSCVTFGYVTVDLIALCFVYPGFSHLILLMMMMI